MKCRLLSVLLCSLLTTLPAAAAPTPEDLLRRELRDTLARVLASEAFAGRAPGELTFSLSVPAERYFDLGLLLDSRAQASAGLEVLGTSPGGAAQALGLQAGDVITRIGTQTLADLGHEADGTARAVGVLRRSVDALSDGGRLALGVRRGDRMLEIDGALNARYLPPLRIELGEGSLVTTTGAAAGPGESSAAATGCGRISVFHIAPRSQDLYPARVLSIDGRIPGPAAQDTYRVAAGAHTVEVAESIDAQDLPTSFSRRRAELGRRSFTVVVEPGRTHLVAAHLRNGSGGRDYWEPVVWKTLDEPCR